MASAKKASTTPTTLSPVIEEDFLKVYKYFPITIGFGSVGTTAETINYITRTSVADDPAGTHAKLGLLSIGTALPDKAVLYPNNIKPGRVAHLLPAGSSTDSSYYDSTKYDTLKADGWWHSSKQKQKYYSLSTKFTTLWYTTINGVNIGHIDNKAKIPNTSGNPTETRLADLGFKKVDGKTVGTIIMGASFPACGIAIYSDGLRYPVNPDKLGATALPTDVVKIIPGKSTFDDLKKLLT